MHAEDFARDRHAQNRANEMSHDVAKSIPAVYSSSHRNASVTAGLK